MYSPLLFDEKSILEFKRFQKYIFRIYRCKLRKSNVNYYALLNTKMHHMVGLKTMGLT